MDTDGLLVISRAYFKQSQMAETNYSGDANPEKWEGHDIYQIISWVQVKKEKKVNDSDKFC